MVTYAKGHHPGTVWRKSDLQCHSPRDRHWRGTATLPGSTAEHEEARTAWAKDFLRACVDRSLSIVAITDHHDFCISAYVAEEAGRDDEVLVFRGIEVTCQDAVQCLVLFDPGCGENVIAKFLGLLTNVLPADNDETHTVVTTACDRTVESLFEAVSREPLVRDHCLLLPHFSNEDAHKSANHPGFAPRFANLPCDGVYIEQQHANLTQATLDKVRGLIPDWGTRRRAVLATGDNRSETWDRLGVHDCWIKVGEHSIEGLRQALLADEARIAFTEPEVPDERIVSLRVQSSLSGGVPLEIHFNAGFNALIGGRGSGKSSIVEYLRFGLGRTANDLKLVDGLESRERDQRLIEETLSDGGFVEIRLERDGVQETWRRDLATRDHITVTSRDGEASNLILDDARRRFRARAFEQKGLSSTMNDRAKAADQITGIAAAEELEQRRQIDEEISKSKRAVTTALRQAANYWQLKLEANRAAGRVVDLKQRLDANAERLTTEGVDEASLKILAEAPEYAQAQSYLTAVSEDSRRVRDDLIEASTDILSAVDEPHPALFANIEEVKAAAATARQRLQEAMAVGFNALDDFEEVLESVTQRFIADAEAFKLAHVAAVAKQSKHRLAIEDNQRIAKEYGEAVENERKARAAAESNAACVEKLVTCRAQLKTNVEKRNDILKLAAEKVAHHSGNALMARLKADQTPEEYRVALERLCESSYVPDASEKCVARSKDLTYDQWSSLCDEYLSLYEQKIMSGSAPEPSEEQAAKLGKAVFGEAYKPTPRSTARLHANLDDERVGSLLAATPKNFIILTYVDDKGRKIPFEKASPGQQASALLELLLRQSAGTLVIDQPEDDLDNKVVMKIVDLIRASKSNRQLIFATHNPNVVVNGDADKVIGLTTGDPDPRPDANSVLITVEEDGAIETPAVKQLITHVMEGGQTAFDLRRRKYRFERHGRS